MYLGVVRFIDSQNNLSVDYMNKGVKSIRCLSFENFNSNELVYVEKRKNNFCIHKISEEEMENLEFYNKLINFIKLLNKKLKRNQKFLTDGIIDVKFDVNIDMHIIIVNQSKTINHLIEVAKKIKLKLYSSAKDKRKKLV